MVHTLQKAVKTRGKIALLLPRMQKFVKKNTVAVIAFVLAAVSCCFIPPDARYAEYFDVKTLCCLFCTLAVICALKDIRFFSIAAQKIVCGVGNTRMAALCLVYITFIGSMLIANDMALLTFLPLGYFVFASTGKTKYMAVVFILQNIAANLGGMLTPFGNPQNLYLYSRFSIPSGEFMGIMFLPFVLSVGLITLCCLFIPKEELTLAENGHYVLPRGRTVLYLALFAATILLVFRVIPYLAGTAVIAAAVFAADRRALKKVDYPLLLTFVCFFIFAGNLSRVEAVNRFFSMLLQREPLLTAVASCQVISNVPSAILLSRFTQNYAPLLVGVNIGGCGTLISSLASLITFREYTRHYKEQTGRYIALFSAFNFGFLLVLCTVMRFIYR